MQADNNTSQRAGTLGPVDGSHTGRWWEGYLVRYLLGGFVGSVCVVLIVDQVLGQSYCNAFCWLGRAPDDDPARWIALFLAGTGYCYIASTPITVIHASRMIQRGMNRYARVMWSGWVVGALLWLLVRIFAPVPNPVLYLWYGLPAVWLLLGQYDCLLALNYDIDRGNIDNASFRNLLGAAFSPRVKEGPNENVRPNSRFLTFYRQLAAARARGVPGSDIRASYTHLREHANSVFIVVSEISLLSTMLGIAALLSDERKLAALAALLFVWLIPALRVWGIANRLERDFAHEPEKYGK
jgi:hypothetical protein